MIKLGRGAFFLAVERSRMTPQELTGSLARDIAHAGLARRARRRRALARHLAVWTAVALLAMFAQAVTPYTH